MAYKIIKTRLAEQDLDNILGYIVLSLANPSAAASFADAVEACYSDLEKRSSKTISWSIRWMRPQKLSTSCDSSMAGGTMKN